MAAFTTSGTSVGNLTVELRLVPLFFGRVLPELDIKFSAAAGAEEGAAAGAAAGDAASASAEGALISRGCC